MNKIWMTRNGIVEQFDEYRLDNLLIKGWVQCEEPKPIIPMQLTDEQKFNSQVCIDRLWVKFITSLAVFSSVSASLIQVLQSKKPDINGSYYNYFWCIKIYLAQVRNSNLISQSDYERVLSVFMEQNINLENY